MYAEKLISFRVGDKWIWISSNVLTIKIKNKKDDNYS